MSEFFTRQIVIPGEVIAKGEKYSAGDGAEKIGNEIIALRYGLAEEVNNTVRVIPLSGVYQPRKGNIVIGMIDNITYYGWSVDLGCAENSFLSLQEVPRYVYKNELDNVFKIGDMIVAKILDVTIRGVDLTVKSKGLGKINEGIIVKINPNRIPRIIGKEGSMISLLKRETGCDIVAGQNGLIWVKGKNIEDEIRAKKAIFFIAERSFFQGVTEELKRWFEKENKK